MTDPPTAHPPLSRTPTPGDRPAVPPTVQLPPDPDVLAPDGSQVRVLARTARLSTAHFRLEAGQVAVGVVHRTVDEVWLVISGAGQIWRCPDGDPGAAVTDELMAGVSIPIPVGTHFQFRAAPGSGVDVLGATVPPWPDGDGEAVTSDLAPWPPSVPAGPGIG